MIHTPWYPNLQRVEGELTNQPVITDNFSNFDDTTMDYILVKSKPTNLIDGTGNSIPGNDIASETS